MNTLKLIIILALLCINLQSRATTMDDLAGLSSKFERTIDIPVKPADMRKIRSVVYGNEQVGYFKAKKWKKDRNNISVSFIPPSYRTALEFYAVKGDGKKLKIMSDRFSSPLPKIFSKMKIEIQKGKLASPFYLMNGALPRRALFNPNFKTKNPAFYKKNANRFTFLSIVNKLGELVWVHVPVIDGALFGSYMSAKKIGDGYFGIMFGKHSGYFEVAKYNGEILREFSSRDAAEPFAMHHDFETIGSNKLYAVGNKIEDLYSYTKDPSHKGKTFLTDTIIGINLKRGTSKELRHFSEEFNPDITPYYTGDRPGDKKFAVWGKPKVDLDFLHINGVEHVPNKGVLVSFRNISKVGLLDSKFKDLIWTVGSEPSDTFYIEKPEDRFLHQHTPVMLSDNELMLFDNAAKTRYSRVVKYQLNKKNGRATKTWEFKPESQFYAKDRSSAYVLPDGNYGVYYVNPRVNGSRSSIVPHRDYYYEVDRNSGEEIARMKITYGAASPGYRVQPISSIGQDQFNGFSMRYNLSKKPRRLDPR